MKNTIRALFVMVTFLLLTLQISLAQTITLKLIQTTDAHGTIFPYDFINDKLLNGSLAQVHNYVREQRKNVKQQVLLLSSGDVLQGQPTVYYYNFERDDTTHLYASVMNYMGYDAGAVGNHDIETGHPVYDKFKNELNFPWLAANAVRIETGEPYFQAYTVVEKSGIKIAILGMVTPAIPEWLPPKIWEGMEFHDMIETAHKWVPIIEQKEKPDLLIGLFHSGVDYTYGGITAETPKNENASKLVAQQVPGFDIIFAGHDHRGWNTFTVNTAGDTVYILAASAHAADAAAATVTMTHDESTDRWQKQISGDVVAMNHYQPDPDFMAQFAAPFEEIKAYVSQPIGIFTETISTRDAIFGNSAFVDLVHQIQLSLTGADLSVSAPLSFDARIDQGTVYVRDMFKLYKFENLLYTMTLTGWEVKNFLEYSYDGWFNQMQDAQDHLLKFSTDENGQLIRSKRNKALQLATPYFNYDSAAGLEYIVDLSKPQGQRINILALADGRIFDFDATYKVAINSYRGNGGGGHLTKGAGIGKDELVTRILSSTDKDLRYFLMKWIEEKQEITPAALGNWHVIPQEWWQAAKERDYKLLYPN